MPPTVACDLIRNALFSPGYVVYQACEYSGPAHMVGTSNALHFCLQFM